jgi:hypothetical protein
MYLISLDVQLLGNVFLIFGSFCAERYVSFAYQKLLRSKYWLNVGCHVNSLTMPLFTIAPSNNVRQVSEELSRLT